MDRVRQVDAAYCHHRRHGWHLNKRPHRVRNALRLPRMAPITAIRYGDYRCGTQTRLLGDDFTATVMTWVRLYFSRVGFDIDLHGYVAS